VNKIFLIGILLILMSFILPIASAEVYGDKSWVTKISSNWGLANEDLRAVYRDANSVYIAFMTDNVTDCCGIGFPLNNSYGNPGGAREVVVAKLDAALGTVTWSTKLQSTGDDYAWGIYADPAGNVYITGSTTGGFADANQFSGPGGTTLFGVAAQMDVFVTKLNSNGVKQWTDIIASITAKDEAGYDIWADNAQVFVTGYTQGGGANQLGGAPHPEWIYPNNGGGGDDAFVAKISNAGGITWLVIVGDTLGTGMEHGNSVYSDGTDVFVAGDTTNGNTFGQGRFVSGTVSLIDSVVFKLNSMGVWDANWAVVTGSSVNKNDLAQGIWADANTVLVTGYTGNGSSYDSGPSYIYGGLQGTEMYVTNFTAVGGRRWTTVLAGAGDDYGYDIVSSTLSSGIQIVSAMGYSSNAGGFGGTSTRTYGNNGNNGAVTAGLRNNGIKEYITHFGTSGGGHSAYAFTGTSYGNFVVMAGNTDDGDVIAGDPTTAYGMSGGTDVFVGSILELGYWTINPKSGLSFELSNGTNVSSVEQSTLVNITVKNTTTNNNVGWLEVNFPTAQVDITLPTITAISDIIGGKVIMHNTSGAYPSIVTNKWVLVPKLEDSLGPYHCPNAAILGDVNISCTNVDLYPAYTEENIDGQDYYRILNQGGGNQEGGGGETVPEFSDYAMFAILVLVGTAVVGTSRRYI